VRTRTKAKIAAQAAQAVVESPALRRAVTTAAPPAAKDKLGRFRRRARRRGASRAAQLQSAARTAQGALQTYGPPAAEALGLIEQPKPHRRRAALAGALAGASTVYFLKPGLGARRRARVALLAGVLRRRGGSAPPPMATA
jgi:hypothetical protein